MERQECIIGKQFNIKCNDKYLHAKPEMLKWILLNQDEQLNIFANSRNNGMKINIEQTDCICNHHKKEFSYPSTSTHPKAPCINPFKTHTKNVPTEKLKIQTYLAHLRGNPYNILPGQRVCINCVSKCKERMKATEQEFAQQIEDPDWVDIENKVRYKKINEVCHALDLSEFKTVKLTNDRILKKAEIKLKEIINAIVDAFIIDGIDLSDVASDDLIQKGKDCDLVFEGVRQKFNKSIYKEKLQLLTLVPESSSIWTLEFTSKFFNCPKYAVRKSRKLKQEYGVLALPPPNKPRVYLSAETISMVTEFYKRESNAWQSPNVRDTKKIKLQSGVEFRTTVNLMHPLKELYELFVKENQHQNLKIGFSSFANLRPPECNLYGDKVMENVCVCRMHGNIELILNALGEGREFRHKLVQSLVCESPRFECMTGVCKKCSKTEKKSRYNNFCSLVEDKLQIDDYENGVKFATWTTETETHRIGLVEMVLPVDKFLKEIYSQFIKYIPHEAITKIQSNAFQEHKKTHAETTALVVGDFSENYNIVCQNAIQSSYFNKTQVTIHPFVAYVRYEETEHVISSAVISDCLHHETASVFAFQKRFLEYLTQRFKHITHIEYWSDGSAAQYKNFKNFANIRCHEQDFGIKASWNFFTTSHGKTGGDGVGATVKHSTRRASLLRINSDFIDTAEKVYKYCLSKGDTWKIVPLFVSAKEVQELTIKFKLNERFAAAEKKKIPQTQKCHRIEILENKILAFRTSTSQKPFFVLESPSDTVELVAGHSIKTRKPKVGMTTLIDYSELRVETWIAIAKDMLWYAAKIVEDPNQEVGTVLVVIVTTPGSEHPFRDPCDKKCESTCIITSDIICCIYPKLAGTTTRSGKQLKIELCDLERVRSALVGWPKPLVGNL